MCLAVPAKIIAIDNIHAWTETMGVRQKVNTQLIDSAAVGDYILVHAGFAIEKIGEEQLRIYNETLYKMIEGIKNDC